MTEQTQPMGIEVCIKPKVDLPDNPSHEDFGGRASRFVMFTTGDAERDKRAIDGLADSLRRAVGMAQLIEKAREEAE